MTVDKDTGEVTSNYDPDTKSLTPDGRALFREALGLQADEIGDAADSDRLRLQDKTNRALFELGKKVHELEKGLEFWAAQVRAVGDDIQDAISQERNIDA